MPRVFSMQIADPVSSDQFHATADRILALPGAYLLLVDLREVTFVTLPSKPSVSLMPGRYIYAGSANGPEGSKPEFLDTRVGLRGVGGTLTS
jgi:hypothetical protein